ncbi:MAG: insulinase family protein [Oscillospiraceae bacterium]|nr:insulinase family protein [Oscillospiraceae bacterium]
MESIINDRLGEGCFKTVLENGFTVLVYPMPHKTAVYAVLASKIGSDTLDFVVDGKTRRVPAGTAHFLEHKMFENEDGVDAFELFARTGASANAFTSFDKTCYLFEASLGARQPLETILGFVGAPYFTEETVEKEQGIIGQEIKMYLDHPGWRLVFSMLELLYHDHSVRHDIAGTVGTIAEITPELLYDFYDAFYNPRNMVLAVSGNISAEEVTEICREEFAKRNWKSHETEVIPCREQDGTAGESSTISMAVSSPQFCLGFKEIPFSKAERIKKELTLEILLDVIAGQTSDLYRKLYDSGLVNTGLYSEMLSGDDYLCVMFSGESEDPEKAIEVIREDIERVKSTGLSEERFLESKRACLGDVIGEYEDVSAVAANLVCSHFKGAGIYDIMALTETIEKEDAEELLSSFLRGSHSAVSLVVPIKASEQ